jgi:streptogramin lyase
MNKRIAVSLVSLLLAGCGGGGGGGGGSTPAAVPVATKTAQMQSGTIGLTFGTQAGTSSKSRTPLFVSPNATSAVVDVNNGPTTTFDVSASSPYCQTVITLGVRTCALPFSVPVGLDSIGVALQMTVAGKPLTLGQGSNSVTVALGTPFTINVGLNPVIAGINSGQLNFPSGTAFTYGTAGSKTGTVVFADASGANITGSGNVPNFYNPPTLVSSDPHITISPTQLLTPGQGVTITYDGSPLVSQQPTISLQIGTFTPGSVQLSMPGLVATRYSLGAVGTIQPGQITVGPDNNIWWVERSSNDVGTLNLTTHTISHYPSALTGPIGIAAGGDGSIYYSNSGTTIARMSTSGAALGTISIGPFGQVGRLGADSGGNVWWLAGGSATSQSVGYIDMTSHAAVSFGPPPTLGALSTSGDITLGSDHAMYITETGGIATHGLLRVTTLANGTAGTMTETTLPNTSISVTPLGIASGSDGNLWIAAFANTATSQFFASATPGALSTITEYTSINPALFANLVNIAKGPDGNLWIAEGGGAAKIIPSAPTAPIVQFFTDDGGFSGIDCVGGPDGNMYCTAVGSAALPPFNATPDHILQWTPR